MEFDFSNIEKKWTKKWSEDEIYRTPIENPRRPFYNLMMFPYPSAEGLHVGSMYTFSAIDTYGRFKRMKGNDVFQPFGLDGFGIHSENYAIKIGEHIKEVSKRTERRYYNQVKIAGLGNDTSRMVETYKPNYYRWTQWLFLKMYEAGLAYRKEALLNYCPSCKTILSDEQVEEGKCERCKNIVEKKSQAQWFFKITDYADRLVENLDWIDWPEDVKAGQRNWIGKSEGAEIDFKILKFEKLLVGTTNDSKVDRIKKLFEWISPDIQVEQVPEIIDTVEDGGSLESNSLKKALAYKGKFENPVISVDSGIFINDVEILEPKRVALGDSDESKCSKEEIHEKMFEYYKSLAEEVGGEAELIFKDVFTIIYPDGSYEQSTAKRNYILTDKQKGRHVNFPLRDLYYSKATGKYADDQTDEEEKIELRPQIIALKRLVFEDLTAFTTRPDTVFGVTFFVVAPEHSVLESIKPSVKNISDVEKFVNDYKGRSTQEIDLDKEKKGLKVDGVKVWNPVKKNLVPLFVGNYVTMDYGTGAVMGVPAHDERDFEFARKYGLDVIDVVSEINVEESKWESVDNDGNKILKSDDDFVKSLAEMMNQSFSSEQISQIKDQANETLEKVRDESSKTKKGFSVNSEFLNGLKTEEAKTKIISYLEENVIGRKKTSFKLRDWCVSRQRYWGPPIPMVHCDHCDEESKLKNLPEKILIGTRNPAKVEMVRELFPKYLGIELISLNDLDEEIDDSDLVEGDDYIENAKLKAEFYYQKTGIPTISTDHIAWMNTWKSDDGFIVHIRDLVNPNPGKTSDSEVIEYLQKYVEENGESEFRWNYAISYTNENGTHQLESMQKEMILQGNVSENLREGFPLDSVLIDSKTKKHLIDQSDKISYIQLKETLHTEFVWDALGLTPKPKVLIIHGTWGSGDGNWFGWLKEKLEERGIETASPTLPDTKLPNYDVRMKFLEENYSDFLDMRTIVIGHSSGAGTAIQLAEKYNFLGLTLVAPVLEIDENYKKELVGFFDEKTTEGLVDIYDRDFDLDKVNQNTGEIAVFFGSDDPYLPKSFQGLAQKMFPEALVEIFDGYQHFSSGTDGVVEAPFLVDLIDPAPNDGWYAVDEGDLPVLLPEFEEFEEVLPDGSGSGPLERDESFWKVECPACGEEAKRETDVSDPFVDSSWYFLRYPMVDFERETIRKMPKNFLPKVEIDQNEKVLKVLSEILKISQKIDVKVWVTGSMAVSALNGEFFKEVTDLDLALWDKEDSENLIAELKKWGFEDYSHKKCVNLVKDGVIVEISGNAKLEKRHYTGLELDDNLWVEFKGLKFLIENPQTLYEYYERKNNETEKPKKIAKNKKKMEVLENYMDNLYQKPFDYPDLPVLQLVDPSDQSKNILKELENLIEISRKHQFDFWVTGSVAVSSLNGGLYKDLSDIDIVIKEKDLKRIIEILKENGYKKSQKEHSLNNVEMVKDWIELDIWSRNEILGRAFNEDDKSKVWVGNLEGMKFNILSPLTLFNIHEKLRESKHRKYKRERDKQSFKILLEYRSKVQTWSPVDMYIGGKEHTVLHLLYARFITMVLNDLGYTTFQEPFSTFFGHGLLIKDGSKMSKSKGNVINPDEYVEKYGADAVRLYLRFLGKFEIGGDFRDTGMKGMYKFVNRVWRLFAEFDKDGLGVGNMSTVHKTIKKIEGDLEKLSFNTAVAKIMEMVNWYEENIDKFSKSERKFILETLLLLLAPMAPFFTEELWEKLGHKNSIHTSAWPKYDSSKVIDKVLEIPVQVNGKLRSTITISRGESKDKVEMLARMEGNVAKYIESGVKKVIYVKDKMINFVV